MRLRRLTAALALAVLVVVGPAAGAAVADESLTTSDPADRAALPRAPAEVALTFSGPPVVTGSHVSVLDESGAFVNSGPLSGTGNTVRQPIAVGAMGDLTVAYHVEFAGGATAVGSLRFSVGTGVAPPPLDPAARRAAEATLPTHHSIDPFSAVLLVVDGVVVLLVLALLRRPRHRRTREEDNTPPAPHA